MNRTLQKVLFPLLLLIGLVAFTLYLALPRQGAQVQASLIGLPTQGDLTGFARADGPREFSFPRDFGAHPDFQTEWWYYTGNLETAQGRQFGFQLTFFRRAVEPPSARVDRPSDWAVRQVYLAHFTLTDVAGRQFQAFEQLERGAAGLAGAVSEPNFQVWLRDWSVEQVGDNGYHLQANADNIRLDLSLTDRKGIILQGQQGYSQKGSQAGDASYYFSQPRLQVEGTVSLSGESYPVQGLSWMDHEYSTSALSQGQVGWDWFSIHLDDGSDLMVYNIRRADGTIDPFSQGTYIAQDGTVTHLDREDFQIIVEDTWHSPHTSAVYPSRWTVDIPSLNLTLHIQPLLADQELNVSYSYWEGAVRVSGEVAGQAISGHGYIELTGYTRSMEGNF